MLRREQRAVDTVARYGGEEFVVLLPETGSAGARLFADRILRRVTLAAFGPPDAPIPITISIGLATFPDERRWWTRKACCGSPTGICSAPNRDGRNRYRRLSVASLPALRRHLRSPGEASAPGTASPWSRRAPRANRSTKLRTASDR